jgi:hypothetical protein
MARTVLTVQTIVKNTAAAITYAAADAVNNMQFLNDGNTQLLVKNGGSGPCTVTVHSVSDPYGRIGDLVLTVAADTDQTAPVLDPLIWNQQGAGEVNNVFVDFSEGSSVEVAAIRRG